MLEVGLFCVISYRSAFVIWRDKFRLLYVNPRFFAGVLFRLCLKFCEFLAGSLVLMVADFDCNRTVLLVCYRSQILILNGYILRCIYCI